MKNFTKQNFKTNPLWIRLLIMAFMLLAGAGTAWGATNLKGATIYFEKPSTWTYNDVYFCIGKSNWSDFNNKMVHVCGNYYKITNFSWDGAEYIGFTNCDVSGWNDNDENFTNRYNYLKNTFCSGKTAPSTNSIATNKIYYIDASGNIQSKNQTSDPTCCTAPASAPSLSKVSDIVKCGTTTTTSGTLKIATVNAGSTYYYKKGTNGSDVQINFGNNNQFTVSSTGDYYVKEVNDCGASSSWSSNVTISETNNSVSISAISGPANLCSNSSADYSITAIGGVSYNWSINSDKFTLGTNGSESISVTANGTEQTSATLTITATKSECPTSNTKVINIIPLPTISTVSPREGTVCSGTTISALENTLTITKSDNSTTKWYKGGEELSSTSVVESGEYTIKAVSNTASCLSSSGITYKVTGITTIPTDLVIDINGSTSATICGGTATINAKASDATSYTLYKGDNTEVETKDGDANGVTFTVSEENTYKVKATNNCGTTNNFSSTVELIVKNVPSKPEFVTEGETTCAEVSVNPNLSKALATGEYLVWYDASEGGTSLGTELVSSSEDGVTTYYAAVSNGTCESAERTPYSVDVEADPIKDLTLTLVDGNGNLLPSSHTYCQGDDVNVKLTYNGGIYWGEPEWNSTLTAGDMNTSGLRYDAVNKKGEGTYTISNLQASGTLQVALTMCGDTKVQSNTLSINITPAATKPNVEVLQNIEKCGSDITKYAQIQIDPCNAAYTYEIGENKVNPNNSGVVDNLSTSGTFTLYAINECGVKTPSEQFTITETDNKPTVSIAGNTSAVFYEDVTLTATATAGATVKWYDGDVEAEGLTYVVTSASDASKTVTAKAFLNGCESAVASHTVAFSAEDCTPEVSNDIQIKFYHPSAKSTDDAKKGQWWGMGTLYYSTNNSTWKSIDMGNSTSGSVTKTITNVTTNKLYVYFESYWTYSHNTKAKTNTLTLDRGNKYDIKITRHGDNNTSATATATKTGSPTQDPPITAPAVKMVSAEYDEVNDKIVASGAVYKTGCGETFWGFQYSADGQTWGTTNEYFIHPSGNSLSVPGEFEYSFPIPDANGGETYYIRAYALNNYNKDNYNLSSAVYSTTSLPVEIPSKTIESATILLVDSEGNESTDTEVCPQSTVYLKVSYVGGDYKEFEATENFPGTNLVEVTRNKLDNYAIFSFTATSAGTANITISNNNSSVTPATGVAITLNDVETITTPVISMDPASGMICSDGEATITIYEPNANYTYALYKDSELADDESKCSYTVNEAGSYTVVATESVCGTSASSMAIELKVVSSDVKINLVADPTTTSPWQPIKLTVTPPAGYDYTLEGINDVEYTQNGDVYTVKIPRPETWPVGNSGTTLKTANKTFTANIKVSDTTSCGSKSVTVKLTDTEENCQ